MGNCAFKGNNPEGQSHNSTIIRVATCNGGVMELYPPITAECVTNGFPGHGIYRTSEHLSQPVLHNEELVAGELYYLRQINNNSATPSAAAPYRVSVDIHQGLSRRQQQYYNSLEVGPSYSYSNRGMWKVKLVITPEELVKILSQESRTEELIESVRMVAKCGNGSTAGSSIGSSDQWSLASSRKAASDNNLG